MLSSRGFMPSALAGNNPLTLPSPMPANIPPTPPLPAAASNPPTPLPSMALHNPLAPMPSAPAPAWPIAGQQVAQQGQPPRARMLIELDGKVTGEVRLQKTVLTVGRLSTSDIYITSKRISRQHAQIVAEQGTWVIEDAGSVNGLLYQGSHVKRLVLSHGDHIRLAPDAVLIYEVIH